MLFFNTDVYYTLADKLSCLTHIKLNKRVLLIIATFLKQAYPIVVILFFYAHTRAPFYLDYIKKIINFYATRKQHTLLCL
jgi:hypothetical protein